MRIKLILFSFFTLLLLLTKPTAALANLGDCTANATVSLASSTNTTINVKINYASSDPNRQYRVELKRVKTDGTLDPATVTYQCYYPNSFNNINISAPLSTGKYGFDIKDGCDLFSNTACFSNQFAVTYQQQCKYCPATYTSQDGIKYENGMYATASLCSMNGILTGDCCMYTLINNNYAQTVYTQLSSAYCTSTEMCITETVNGQVGCVNPATPPPPPPPPPLCSMDNKTCNRSIDCNTAPNCSNYKCMNASGFYLADDTQGWVTINGLCKDASTGRSVDCVYSGSDCSTKNCCIITDKCDSTSKICVPKCSNSTNKADCTSVGCCDSTQTCSAATKLCAASSGGNTPPPPIEYGGAFGGTSGIFNCGNSTNSVWTLNCIFPVFFSIINWLLEFSAISAIIMIIFGGIKTITSNGDPKNVAAGRRILTFAILGMFIILLSFFAIRFIATTTGVACINPQNINNFTTCN